MSMAGERIGAFDDQNIARLRLAQRLRGAQRRQRAFEAAQIEGLFGHCLASSSKRSNSPYHIGDGSSIPASSALRA